MAEPETMRPLTTEDYTHEGAIARIEHLEEGMCEAIELCEKGDAKGAAELLKDVLAEEEPEDEEGEEEGDEDEEDDEDDED